MAEAFVAEALSKRYGVDRGAATGFARCRRRRGGRAARPNGAGKSTLAKIACGLVHPSAGAASVAGHPAGSREARRAVGYLAELFRFPGLGRPQTSSCACISGSVARAVAPASAPSCSSWSASPTRRGPASRRCRRGCSSGSGSRRRWSAARGCCCWTSPRARSTRPGAGSSAGCSTRSARAASRCCSARTCSARSSWSAIESRSWSRARSSSGGRPPSSPARAGSRSRRIRACAHTRAPGETGAGIVAGLVAAGERIYGVRVLASTLEDAYLEAVGEEPSERGEAPGRHGRRRATIVGFAFAESLRRRVFAVVGVLTLLFSSSTGSGSRSPSTRSRTRA